MGGDRGERPPGQATYCARRGEDGGTHREFDSRRREESVARPPPAVKPTKGAPAAPESCPVSPWECDLRHTLGRPLTVV
jgi:hypothetical protein